MSSLHRLLARPVPFDDEWWASYLVRLATKNGVCWRSAFFREAAIEHAAREFGFALHDSHWRGTSPRLGLWPDVELPAWARCEGLRNVFVCPACWKHAPYIRAYWRLRGCCACLAHRQPLVQLARFGTDTSSKEAPFAQLGPTSTFSQNRLGDDSLALMNAVWGPIVLDHPDTQALVLAALYSKMLTVVAAARRGKDRERPSTNWLELVADWLRANRVPLPRLDIDWGETFIQQLVYPVHKAALVRLFDQILTSTDACLSGIPISGWRDLATIGAGPVHGRGAGGGFHVLINPETGIPVHELRNTLGVGRSNMTRWIQRLDIEPVARLGVRRKFLVISTNDAEQIARLAQQFRGNKHACRIGALAHLGLTRRRNVVRRLVQARQLKIAGAGPTREFVARSPDDLLSALERTALPIDECRQPSVSLDDETLYHRVWTGPIEELYEDLKSGTEQVFRCDSKRGLARFAVPIHVLTRLTRRTADYARNRARDPRQLELPHVGSASAISG